MLVASYSRKERSVRRGGLAEDGSASRSRRCAFGEVVAGRGKGKQVASASESSVGGLHSGLQGYVVGRQCRVLARSK